MVDIENEIKNLLEDGLQNRVAEIYLGYVNDLPAGQEPIIFVYGSNERLATDRLTTAKDKYVYTINIDVILQYNNDLQQDLQAQERIKNLIDTRNVVHQPLGSSIVGILRNNLFGDRFQLNQEIEIEYYPETKEDEPKTNRSRVICTLVSKHNFRFNQQR